MIEHLLSRYGLLAIFLGAGVEGEAVVLSGGVLAARGIAPLWAAMIAATCGSAMIDQAWFWAARSLSHKQWIIRQTAKPAFARALHFLERHPKSFILAFRFIYGMRTVSPIAIGMSHIPARIFVPLNLIAAAIWAPLFTWIGFRFGGDALGFLRQLPGGYLWWSIAATAIAVGAWMLYRRRA